MAVVSAVAMFAGSFTAYGQGDGSELRANVAFEFTAGDRSFPAGSYTIARRSADAPSLVISPEAGGDYTMVLVLTRLARWTQTPVETAGNLVFDTVGDDHVLSEVWMPGQDGFLVRSTSEDHQHEVVQIVR